MSSISAHKMPMVFSTTQASEYMGISPNTLRRYAKLMGIESRKMYGVRGRFYFFHEIVQMMNLRAPKGSLYRPRLLDRYYELRKAGLDKSVEPD